MISTSIQYKEINKNDKLPAKISKQLYPKMQIGNTWHKLKKLYNFSLINI
jgi:hypothetical protein